MTSQPPRALTIADDPTLVALIGQAQRRVVLMAPAFSEAVGQALGDTWRALGPDAVTVIVDVHPESYRLGYGSFEALRQLQAVASAIGGIITQQPGVRLGLLISDDQTLIWAPPAQLIEAGPQRPEAPNAIRLGIPPADVEADLGQGPDGLLSRTVGMDPPDRKQLDTVAEQLKLSPPQKFDIARQVRVFDAFFEFVELELSGVLINRRTVRLPPHLLGIADARTREKLNTTIRLLDKDNALSGQSLLEHRNLIAQRHLRHIPGYGMAIRHADKPAFRDDVMKLGEALEVFQQMLYRHLQKQIDRTRQVIFEALLPVVQKSPPSCWQASSLFGPQNTKQFLENDLAAVFGDTESWVQPMHVAVRFKAVTYASLNDPVFLAAAHQAFPDLKQLHTEQDVAAPVPLTPPVQTKPHTGNAA